MNMTKNITATQFLNIGQKAKTFLSCTLPWNITSAYCNQVLSILSQELVTNPILFKNMAQITLSSLAEGG